jgi:hypothetical protein
MVRSSGPCKTANPSESVHQQLNRLAVATILAGVGLLAVARPAAAKVVYTPVNVTISGTGSIKLDLNHDGIIDFTVLAVVTSEHCDPIGHVTLALVNVTPSKGNGVVATSGDAVALGVGAQIDSSQSFDEAEALMTDAVFKSGPPPCLGDGFRGDWCHGSFTGGQCQGGGYLGLEFQIKGSTHYGWAQMAIAANSRGELETTLVGFAYETTPSQVIKTGQTSGDADDTTGSPDSANPESFLGAPVTNPTQAESLAMLALGAQDLPLCRRNEPKGPASENT